MLYYYYLFLLFTDEFDSHSFMMNQSTYILLANNYTFRIIQSFSCAFIKLSGMCLVGNY